jgi:hypothetical protein
MSVTDVNTQPVHLDAELGRQLGVVRWIGVAEHRPDWSDQPQLVENRRASNITCMQNQLNPR